MKHRKRLLYVYIDMEDEKQESETDNLRCYSDTKNSVATICRVLTVSRATSYHYISAHW
jgi:hypothetical protein